MPAFVIEHTRKDGEAVRATYDRKGGWWSDDKAFEDLVIYFSQQISAALSYCPDRMYTTTVGICKELDARLVYAEPPEPVAPAVVY